LGKSTNGEDKGNSAEFAESARKTAKQNSTRMYGNRMSDMLQLVATLRIFSRRFTRMNTD